MLDAVPGIKELANIKGEQVANVGSQDMSFDTHADRRQRRINVLLSGKDVDAIVVNARHRTLWKRRRFFLNFSCKESDKPSGPGGIHATVYGPSAPMAR